MRFTWGKTRCQRERKTRAHSCAGEFFQLQLLVQRPIAKWHHFRFEHRTGSENIKTNNVSDASLAAALVTQDHEAAPMKAKYMHKQVGPQWQMIHQNESLAFFSGVQHFFAERSDKSVLQTKPGREPPKYLVIYAACEHTEQSWRG